MRRFLKNALWGAVFVFAAIGLLFTVVFVGMRFGIFDVRGSILDRNAFFTMPASAPCDENATACAWNRTAEWETVAGGLQKDTAVLDRVSRETGVPARLIAAVAVPEQIRFFTSEREIFKSYFEPLKILGSLSQFSLGVSGIKEETASAEEGYANDPSSPRYPGPAFAALIAYTPEEVPYHDTVLYNRLTDPKDHYYSYLYTALYIKEVEAEWQNAGFPIADKPGIIATLFNVGFGNSKPNATPQAGGAPISLGGTTYSFGELAALFYDSDELGDILPRSVY